MAIPFNLPSDEETENNYRSMDDLLAQLFRVLRQILIRVPAEQANDELNHNRVQPVRPHGTVPPPDVIPRLPLPDVVPGHPRPPPRRCRRRRVQRRREGVPEKVAAAVEVDAPRRKVAVRDNWTQVGDDLRDIADEFATSLQHIDPKRLETASNQKGISFLSLLVPPSFRGSIWMAVVFLFGWGALHRSR